MFAEISNHTVQTAATSGFSLGSMIAVVCSWQRNRSIFWCMLHSILSWGYVLYFAETRRPAERPS
jgi:hypothetical protein